MQNNSDSWSWVPGLSWIVEDGVRFLFLKVYLKIVEYLLLLVKDKYLWSQEIIYNLLWWATSIFGLFQK